MNELTKKIEAILFYKGTPTSLKDLTKATGAKGKDVENALVELRENLEDRGIVLQENAEKYTLGTAPEMSEIIEKFRKEELNKNLSKAALETLSIILYKNGIHRAYVDYIRGVNSSFILRILSMRGLIEHSVDPSDSRRYIYKPTFELLSLLGIKNIGELPEYDEIMQKLDESYKIINEMNTESDGAGNTAEA